MTFGGAMEFSGLQKNRSFYMPELPSALQKKAMQLQFGDATAVPDPSDAQAVSRSFPLTYGQRLVHFLSSSFGIRDSQFLTEHPVMRIGVVFCGRQSPGGHNIIYGLYDAIKTHNRRSTLIGFCGGTEGLFEQKTIEITENIVLAYRNQGGYDMLGRTKDQIRTTEQVHAALNTCQTLDLDGLVIIGGVTSHTDAAQLAETFAELKCQTKVVGVPVTLYGDLKNQFVEANVGFDTICKVNAQLISNLCTDALSAEKYYYFIRLMGRKASHVALECAHQCKPNMVILSEEVASSKLTLFDITKRICDAVEARAEQGKYHGVILLPEGLIESIPEVHALLQEIHGLYRKGVSVDKIASQLSPWASALFEFLPSFIKEELLLSPDSDESAPLSQIETEKLLAQLVEIEMDTRSKSGRYKGKKFNSICHFFGYQARGSLPSKFDCDYAYAMMTVKRLHGPRVSLIGKPSIHPAAINLKGKAYEMMLHDAEKLLMDDLYRNPGPLQFEGPGSDSKTISLTVEQKDYIGKIKELQDYLDKVKMIVKPGCSQEVLKVALSSMACFINILSLMSPHTTEGHTL
ncbi:Phosphofructokinase domain-containing protein [Cinnamomum micranthum f. kanehirae]|uniref:Phosphofructokinase domain-containing protein n=1 Tax=Cinnamomum micranthum f. kanehirae TaxID=337451 RepID=A0A443NQ15_9MAGN|nr:Phosphofructokinase domain-containing protein [Cinnamomum micranthum f. kanehirae]